jgi:hypothetical protein
VVVEFDPRVGVPLDQLTGLEAEMKGGRHSRTRGRLESGRRSSG